jgi:hypothetical protein
MNNPTSPLDLKEPCRALYTKHGYDITELSALCGVSAHDLQQWIKDGSWNLTRQTLAASKEALLEKLYELMQQLNEGQIEKDGLQKIAELMLKYTGVIKNLESEDNLRPMILAATAFTDWLYKRSPEQARTFVALFDSYITEHAEAE